MLDILREKLVTIESQLATPDDTQILMDEIKEIFNDHLAEVHHANAFDEISNRIENLEAKFERNDKF